MRFCIVVIFLFLTDFVFAQIGGTAVYGFLNLPSSPQQAAMGGKNVSAQNRDLSLQNQNPALLNAYADNLLMLNFSSYFAGIKYGNVAYAKTFDKYSAFASLQYLNYGKFVQADENGNITGEFSANEYLLTASFSTLLDTQIMFGVSVKPVFSQLYEYKSFGIAADMGLLYFSADSLTTLGVVFRNLGCQIVPYVKGNREKLPFEIIFGFTQKLKHAPFRFSVTAENLQSFSLTFPQQTQTQTQILGQQPKQRAKIWDYGEEALRHLIFAADIIPSKYFYVQTGFNYRRHQELRIPALVGGAGFSGGIGIVTNKFFINYAFAKFFAGATNHLFSITLKINELKNKSL